MRKSVKVFLIILCILVGAILLDTLQARIFMHSPIISWKEEMADEDSYVDRGIIVDTFYCTKEKDIQTIYWKFKGSKFTCYIDNLSISYQDIMDKINNYFAMDDSDNSNMAYWTVDAEKNVVIVGMMDISKEKQNEFINNVFSSYCGSNYTKYIKDNKMIEFRESIDTFDGKIIEAKDTSITVEVLKDSKSFKKSDRVTMKITRPINGTNDFYVVSNKVRITFNGLVETSNPAQISATKIELITE